ncbi:hypothetical protein QIS74_10168 [Colletotrichum tabaci]|uniref:Putative gamma-glutamylcyclotransferase n=1 Tax=Colletotrichum tabaci TaxID=1209068 RepID=A0AAV9T3C2_9PEZI
MDNPSASPAKPPTPPTLSPLVSPRQHERESPYLAKLASAPDDWLCRPVDPPTPYTYEPIHYFFYGTLAQPDLLKRILDLEQEPELRPGKVIGYSLSSWGQYKALVDGRPGEEVIGHGFLVESAEQEFKLARYETSAYELAPCMIFFTDGKSPEQAQAKTFMYAGDSGALKDGRFDASLWELQMGMRLPPRWRRQHGGEEESS